jgi:hypothetical protein
VSKHFAIYQLRGLINALDHEAEDLLLELPTLAALQEYRALWLRYDAEGLAEVFEAIAGGASPEPLKRFIRRWRLSWTIPKECFPKNSRFSRTGWPQRRRA